MSRSFRAALEGDNGDFFDLFRLYGFTPAKAIPCDAGTATYTAADTDLSKSLTTGDRLRISFEGCRSNSTLQTTNGARSILIESISDSGLNVYSISGTVDYELLTAIDADGNYRAIGTTTYKARYTRSSEVSLTATATWPDATQAVQVIARDAGGGEHNFLIYALDLRYEKSGNTQAQIAFVRGAFERRIGDVEVFGDLP